MCYYIHYLFIIWVDLHAYGSHFSTEQLLQLVIEGGALILKIHLRCCSTLHFIGIYTIIIKAKYGSQRENGCA